VTITLAMTGQGCPHLAHPARNNANEGEGSARGRRYERRKATVQSGHVEEKARERRALDKPKGRAAPPEARPSAKSPSSISARIQAKKH